MRIVGVRLSPEGETFVAMLPEVGQPARILTDLVSFWAAPAAALSSAVDDAPSVDVAELTFVPPVPAGARVLCVRPGAGGRLRVEARWSASLAVDGSAVPLTAANTELHWGAGIAAYVGTVLNDAHPDAAGESIIGYSTFTDLTATGSGLQPVLARNGDNTGPLGPLVTRDEAGDLDAPLRVRVSVTEAAVHDGAAIGSAHGLSSAVSFISGRLTLHPGDLVVLEMAAAADASTPLRSGSVVQVDVERLGTLTNPVVGHERRVTVGGHVQVAH